MNRNENLKNLKKKFNLYDNEELFATFEYDNELKRYQSDYGYLTIEKVYELANGKEKDKKIIWI